MAPKRHVVVDPPLSDAPQQFRGEPIAGEPAFEHSRETGLWERIQLGEWDAYVRFVAQDGHPVIAELRVLPRPHSTREEAWVREWFEMPENLNPELVSWEGPRPKPPDTPSGGLTARNLRKLTLGRALSAAYRHLDRHYQRDPHPDSLLGQSIQRFAAQAISEPRQPGRRGRGDAFYAHVASAYVEAITQGSRKPVKDAALALSKAWSGTYEDTYVRDLLNEARHRGLLTRPPKGRAGGELTEKGRQALGEETK